MADIALVRHLLANSRTLEVYQKTAEGHTFLERLIMKIGEVSFMPYAACIDELLSSRVPVTLSALAMLWEHISAECALLRWTPEEEFEPLMPSGQGSKDAKRGAEAGASGGAAKVADLEAVNTGAAPRKVAIPDALKRMAGAGPSIVGSGGKPTLAPVTEDDEGGSNGSTGESASGEGAEAQTDGDADLEQTDRDASTRSSGPGKSPLGASIGEAGSLPVRAQGAAPSPAGADAAPSAASNGVRSSHPDKPERRVAEAHESSGEHQAAVAALSAPESDHAARVRSGVDEAMPGSLHAAGSPGGSPAAADNGAQGSNGGGGGKAAFNTGLKYQGVEDLDGLLPVHKAGADIDEAAVSSAGTRPPGRSQSAGAAAVASVLDRTSPGIASASQGGNRVNAALQDGAMPQHSVTGTSLTCGRHYDDQGHAPIPSCLVCLWHRTVSSAPSCVLRFLSMYGRVQ